MLGHQHSTQYFPRFHQMMQVSAAPGPAYGAAAPFIKRPLVPGKAGIADVQRSAPGKGLPVSSAARRQLAIEHLDPAFDRTDHASRLATSLGVSAQTVTRYNDLLQYLVFAHPLSTYHKARK